MITSFRFKSGLFRHEFTIWKNSNSSTTLTVQGREEIVETRHCTVKGFIQKIQGVENVLSNQEFLKSTHEFFCWFVPNIDTKMWLIGLNGKRFNIIDVDNIEEQNSKLRLLLCCESS